MGFILLIYLTLDWATEMTESFRRRREGQRERFLGLAKSFFPFAASKKLMVSNVNRLQIRQNQMCTEQTRESV